MVVDQLPATQAIMNALIELMNEDNVLVNFNYYTTATFDEATMSPPTAHIFPMRTTVEEWASENEYKFDLFIGMLFLENQAEEDSADQPMLRYQHAITQLIAKNQNIDIVGQPNFIWQSMEIEHYDFDVAAVKRLLAVDTMLIELRVEYSEVIE